jgi:HEAT repeat protein
MMHLAPLALTLVLLPAQKPLPPQKPPPAPQPAPAPALVSDEQVLKGANLPTTGPELLNFFRKRTPPGPEKTKIADWIKQLSDSDAAVRGKAAFELTAAGMAAVPQLREAANGIENQEAAKAARSCLDSIAGPNAGKVTSSAAHVIAAQKPDGAAGVLLTFLPYAEDQKVVQDIQEALYAVGGKDGKADSALLKALEDEEPCRRAAAAETLCRLSGDNRHAVRPLLKDAKPTVRFRAAMGLVSAYDPEAVPVLIDLVGDLPPSQRKQAEDYLTDLAGEWAVNSPKGNDAVSRRLRREVWSTWWRGTDGGQLLDEFRNRTLSEEEREKACALILKLDDAAPAVRDKAEADLLDMGPKVASLLRRAAEKNEGRTSPAAQCLQRIEKDTPNPLPLAAPRLLALRRPEGTTDAMLAYLPFADSEEVASQLRDLLVTVGFREGKPEAALVRALEDKAPARRAAAAWALCRGGATDQFPAVGKLLKDEDSTVRLRAGFALAGAGVKDAVPVLIDLLAELPLQDAWQIEDYLQQVAGDKGPNAPLGADKDLRAKAKKAWSTWWSENAEKVDLAKIDINPRYLGYLLVVEPVGGRVLELNASGKIRWQIDKIQQPQDAQVLPGNRVVMIDVNNNAFRVCERDLTGKVIWEKNCQNPFLCQRMRNGNTFVACRNQLLEFDRDGKEVQNIFRQNDWLMTARKFPDGGIAFFNNQGMYTRLDATGKEMKTFRVNLQFGFLGSEILPGDHVLVSQGNNKVTEFDAEGKSVWEADIVQPGNPHRLPNGHTIVVHNAQNRLTELDRQGKVFKEWKDLPCRPFRVYSR